MPLDDLQGRAKDANKFDATSKASSGIARFSNVNLSPRGNPARTFTD